MREHISKAHKYALFHAAMTPAARVRRILQLKGWTQMRLAAEIGVSQSTVHRWIGGAEPEGGHRDRLNELFTMLFTEDVDNPQVPLKGHIGAGQRVEAIEGSPEFVIAPPKANDNTVAARVRGNSMFPMFEDGWLVYWSTRLPPEEMINKLCIVHLENGEILVKKLLRGSEPWRFHLASLNGPMIENAIVDSVSPIDWIRPT